MPVRSVPVGLLLLALLGGCTQNPSAGTAQPTEPPPTPLTAPSSPSSSPIPSNLLPSGSTPSNPTLPGSGPSGPGTVPSGTPGPMALSPEPSVAAGPADAPAPRGLGPARVRSTYVFPVRSEAASFGRAHHDYPATDVFAPCGSPAVAVTDGVVVEVFRQDKWTARKDAGATRGGLAVAIVGTDGVRYYGSHLKSVTEAVVPGYRVRAGEVLGRVGRTGSARSTPCHLHFGISPPCAEADWWNRRGVLAPYPFLKSWQHGGHRSPVKAVAEWRAEHGCPKKAPARD
jgi:murein DD-endopeptidase MepM/ murein hydrolase activator NlpD